MIHALIFGAGLTIFVVYAFLNSWRSTLITGLSLPTSAIAAFIAVWLCGFTLNFMTLLGLSLAIGVLIDDAIVVRENIVRHMERGEDRVTAARNGTAEIGLAVDRDHVLDHRGVRPGGLHGRRRGRMVPAVRADRGGLGAGEPVHLVHARPDAVGLLGRPAGPRARASDAASASASQRFNNWFDHQAEPLRQRHRVGAAPPARGWRIARWSCWSAALGLQLNFGGSEFLPKSDYGTLAIEVRTPSIDQPRIRALKVEKAAELARTHARRPRPPTAASTRRGGRVWVDIGKTRARPLARLETLAADLRDKLKQLVGAEYVVLDDLNNGARKPVQIQFYGTDSRKLMEITNDFMDKMRKIPGAVDVGLSEQDPKDELQIELDRGLANQLGISVGDAAQTLRVAFAGVEVGDWVDPTGESRDVAVRLHPKIASMPRTSSTCRSPWPAPT